MTYADFRKIVWAHYKKHGRHDLPWRNLPADRQGCRDPYKILVSEMMLQQTQVARVIPYYRRFIKKYPTARHLAAAPLGSVLVAWQGLGYNRRARTLREAAQLITKNGRFPRTVEEIDHLPGVGPYTARAIAAFAFNTDCLMLETNIRTALLHHFFKTTKQVSDEKLLQLLAQVLPKGQSREWYSALMDYGAHLKASGIKLNAKSKKHASQSRFVGSNREARGAIVRELARGSRSEPRLIALLGDDRAPQLASALRALISEGLVIKRDKAYLLP